MLPGISSEATSFLFFWTMKCTRQVEMEVAEVDGGYAKHRALAQRTRTLSTTSALAKVKGRSWFHLNINKVIAAPALSHCGSFLY